MEQQTRKVLLIGGPDDGKWKEASGQGTTLSIPRPTARLSLTQADYKVDSVGAVAAERGLPVPAVQFDQYWLDSVTMYGMSIWVGYHAETLSRLEREQWTGTEPRIRILLKAILQRDVATEMGL